MNLDVKSAFLYLLQRQIILRNKFSCSNFIDTSDFPFLFLVSIFLSALIIAQVLSIILFGYILMFLLVNLLSEVRSAYGKINRKLITYFILHYLRFIINVNRFEEISFLIHLNPLLNKTKKYRMKFDTSIHASFLGMKMHLNDVFYLFALHTN